MVTAGVYMVSRASWIYVKAPSAMMIVAIIGAATALFAATIAIAQWDIKKVLAYSTISQLGYMFLACGVGAFGAGIFHVFTHAFFKALLFLGAGSVIVGMHHVQEMQRMGGLKKYMPWTFRTMVAGWLAIAGVPLLSGFFSKDEILFRTFTSDAFEASSMLPRILWVVAAATALLTAVYMTRMMVLTFWGKERFSENGDSHANHSEEHSHHPVSPRESPPSMVAPLVVLAVGAIVAGYVGVPEGLSGGRIQNYFEHFLRPAIADRVPAGQAAPPHSAQPSREAIAEDHGTEISLTVVSSIIAIGGLLIGWTWFTRKPLWQPPRLLEQKYRIDEAYDAAVVEPLKQGSTSLLWKIIDVRIIDGAVNGLAALAASVGGVLRQLQSGLARSYVAVVVFGALLIIGYFVIR
jgi:NADH-quinone oxidoreductase subunit L